VTGAATPANADAAPTVFVSLPTPAIVREVAGENGTRATGARSSIFTTGRSPSEVAV
jgi:hypothetical protein